MDRVIEPGRLKQSVLENIYDDVIIVKKIPGKVLLQALEVSLSGVPDSFVGGFLQISGIRLTYDYTKKPRIQSITVGKEPL